MKASWVLALAALAGCALAPLSGCRRERNAVEKLAAIPGIAQVPGEANVIVGVDIQRLVRVPVLQRVFAEALRRDAGLSEQLAKFADACNMDFLAVTRHVLVAQMGQGKSRDSLVIASGRFDGPALVSCLGQAIGTQLVTVNVAGRTAYRAEGLGLGSRRTLWLHLNRDSALVASSKYALTRAMARELRLTDNADFVALMAHVDTHRALWAAGMIPADVGRGLVELLGPSVATPKAIHGHLDDRGGIKLVLGVQMQSEGDAAALVSKAIPQLRAIAEIASRPRLGALADATKITQNGREARFELLLNPAALSGLVDPDVPAIDKADQPDQNPRLEPSKGNFDEHRDAAAEDETPLWQQRRPDRESSAARSNP